MKENNTTLYEETTVEELQAAEAETTAAESQTTEVETTAAESQTTEVETTVEAVSRGEIGFTPDSLSWSLPIMGKGMLGIFIVTTIIVGVTVILNKVTAPRKKKEKKDK